MAEQLTDTVWRERPDKLRSCELCRFAESARGVGADDADSVGARWIEGGWVDVDSGRKVLHTQGGMQKSRHRVWHNRAGAGRTVWRCVLDRTIAVGIMWACIAALLTPVGDLPAGSVGRVVGSVGDGDGVDLHRREWLEVRRAENRRTRVAGRRWLELLFGRCCRWCCVERSDGRRIAVSEPEEKLEVGGAIVAGVAAVANTHIFEAGGVGLGKAPAL